jgi:hypothetical protein
VAAYRKVIELKPDFVGYQNYIKLAVVYDDQQKFALADSALREFGKRSSGAAKLYVDIFQAQFQERRGDLEGARKSYQNAVRGLARAGQNDAGEDAMVSLLSITEFTGGNFGADITFARQQKLSGHENGPIALMQAAEGDTAGSEKSFSLYQAALPDIGAQGTEQFRAVINLFASLSRKDAQGVLAAESKLPDYNGEAMHFAAGWACLQTKDYARAEKEL